MNQQNKTIGIVAKWTKEGVGVATPYRNFLRKFANIVFIDPSNRNITPVDLLVLQGGADVNPLRYGQFPADETQGPDLTQEFFDVYTLPKYLAEGIPVFGICRGFQTLCVHYGCSMEQHISQAVSSKSRRERVDSQEITQTVLDLGLLKLDNFSVKKKEKADKAEPKTIENCIYETNSLHHQGLFRHNINDKIIPLMINNSYKNIEAMITSDGKAAGVQWHPEELIFDQFSINLINLMLNGGIRKNKCDIENEAVTEV